MASEARDVEKKKDGKLEVEARKARGQVRIEARRAGRLVAAVAPAAAWRSGGERIFHFIWSRF